MDQVQSYLRADVEASVGSVVAGGANGYAPPSIAKLLLVQHFDAPSRVGFRWGHRPFRPFRPSGPSGPFRGAQSAVIVQPADADSPGARTIRSVPEL